MKRDLSIDLHAVRPEHLDIHYRLLDWAIYVTPKSGRIAEHPMWKKFVPRGGDDCEGHIDRKQCMEMEKQVTALPRKHRLAVSWCYLAGHRGNSYTNVRPDEACRELGVSRRTLADLIHDSRSMIRNRLR